MTIQLAEGINVDEQTSILVIEDSRELNDVLTMGLKNFGFKGKIFQALDLETAVQIIKLHKIDLFVVDWVLPDGEGASLVKKLRSSSIYETTPILLITGRDDISSQSDFTEFGIGALLVKPFSMEDFKLELAKIYGFRQGQQVNIPKDTQFLVADDQVDIVKLIKELLENLGHKSVFTAYSLKETSEILQQNKIQFLITDWAFQDGSCIELIEKLRKTSDYKNLPIMVVTGRDSIDDLMTLVQLDVKDHLVKPFTFVEFEEKLNYCWERKQKSRV